MTEWIKTNAGGHMSDAHATTPPDRFCDLVMKGGITSGIVYPPAIAELAREYRFKNIGGTSAGAIAAAVAAAAEYQRRRTGSLSGFQRLARLPAELGETDAKHNTRLFKLFQPDPPCRRLFGILAGSLNQKTTMRRAFAIVGSSIRSYWISSAGSIALGVLVGYLHSMITGALLLSMIAGVLVVLVTLPVFVLLAIYLDATRSVVNNNYGLCKGLTPGQTRRPGHNTVPALTDWLHALIQEAAGLQLDKPLTFGNLWDAPGGPKAADSKGDMVPVPRSIDLRMFTTNLAHGRPYVFPHERFPARLFFNPEEIRLYLPKQVFEWFVERSLPYEPNPLLPFSDPEESVARKLNLREIPASEDVPILLAARMSLSFPLLFSTVPLWAIDYEHPSPRTFKRCMFSDGGISSNFPMHLFDGLVPQWPTFGINLEEKLPDREGMTFLPEHYMEGIADRWTRFDEQARNPTRMGGFLVSIISAMQNWNDNMLSRMPGVRDRVVRVRLTQDEGGLNLNMDKNVIKAVSDRGQEAAAKLIARFLGPPPANGWDGWSFQRWVRLDVLLSALYRKTGGVFGGLNNSVPHSKSYRELIQLAIGSAPPGHDEPLTPEQAVAVEALITALNGLAVAFGTSAPGYPNDPLPQPDLRVRPPL